MDFESMLSFLQNLLTNKQSTQASQFGQGLGFQQQQLGQQGDQFNKNLNAQIAAQQAAERLAQEKQRQAEQEQQFQENQTTRQTSFPYLTLMSYLQRQNNPAAIQAEDAYASALTNRYDPMSSSYAYGIPTGEGFSFNPYQDLMTSKVGVPLVKSAGAQSAFKLPALQVG